MRYRLVHSFGSIISADELSTRHQVALGGAQWLWQSLVTSKWSSTISSFKREQHLLFYSE
jgi:hypothetical protein